LHEDRPVTDGQSVLEKHLISRRRLLKQAGAAGVALTALYVAPSFSSVGPRLAYASVTSVPPTPTPCPEGQDLCEGHRKARQLTLVYTGDGGDGTNIQGDKSITDDIVAGWTDPSPPAQVKIKWMDEKHLNDPPLKTEVVDINGNFVIDAATHGHDHRHKNQTEGRIHLGSRTILRICTIGDVLLQEIEFHTSCSKPLRVGDTFGAMRLATFVDEGGFVNCETEEEVDNDPEEDICGVRNPGGKKKKHTRSHLESLTLAYTGSSSTILLNDQAGRATVDNNGGAGPNGDTSVWIIAEDNKGKHTWFDGPVFGIGTSFIINEFGLEKDELKANTIIKIYDSTPHPLPDPLPEPELGLLQTINLHTSCSKPLSVLDAFGAVTVTGFVLSTK